MECYIGTEIVFAEPTTRYELEEGGHFDKKVGEEWSEKDAHILKLLHIAKAGYAVEYPGGQKRWVPKDLFEETYQRTSGMNFGLAIEATKKGRKIARSGWNGKEMFVYYVPAASYETFTEIARKHFGNAVPYGAYLAMKTAQGNVVPWLASQTDILADDWYLA